MIPSQGEVDWFLRGPRALTYWNARIAPSSFGFCKMSEENARYLRTHVVRANFTVLLDPVLNVLPILSLDLRYRSVRRNCSESSRDVLA